MRQQTVGRPAQRLYERLTAETPPPPSPPCPQPDQAQHSRAPMRSRSSWDGRGRRRRYQLVRVNYQISQRRPIDTHTRHATRMVYGSRWGTRAAHGVATPAPSRLYGRLMAERQLRHHRQDRRPSRPDQGQDQAQHAAHPTSPGPRPHDGQATSRPMTVQPYPRFAGPTSDPLRAPQSDTGTQTAPQSPTQAADGQHSAAESRSRAARRQRDEQAYLFSPLEG